MELSDRIVTEARKWLGVRWHHQGRSRAGIDCVGLLVLSAAGAGVPLDDYREYSREASHHELLRQLRLRLTPVRGNLTVPGLVGAFRDSRYPCHVGIFSERDGVLHVIHARADRHMVVEEPFSAATATSPLVATYAMPGATA